MQFQTVFVEIQLSNIFICGDKCVFWGAKQSETERSKEYYTVGLTHLKHQVFVFDLEKNLIGFSFNYSFPVD